MATEITPTAIDVGFSHASSGSPAALPSGRRPDAMPPMAAASGNGVSSDEALLFERLASRVLYTDESLRAPAGPREPNQLGQEGLWAMGVSGARPSAISFSAMCPGGNGCWSFRGSNR